VLLVLMATTSMIQAFDIDDFLDTFNHLKRRGVAYRPVLNNDVAVNVSLTYNLMNIVNVDGANGIVTLRGWINLEWKDSFLKWDHMDEYPLANHRVPTGDIWTPDIMAYNAIEERIDDTLAVVTSSGYITLIRPVTHQFQCSKLDAGTYECPISLGSWTYNGFEINLGAYSGLNVDEFMESPRWGLGEHTSEVKVDIYECCPEPYVKLAMKLTIERKSDY